MPGAIAWSTQVAYPYDVPKVVKGSHGPIRQPAGAKICILNASLFCKYRTMFDEFCKETLQKFLVSQHLKIKFNLNLIEAAHALNDATQGSRESIPCIHCQTWRMGSDRQSESHISGCWP